MSLSVVELNDHNLKVGSEAGLLLRSPGFALVEGDGLKLGDAAEAASRVSPTSSYNKYWLDLSLDPLNHDNHLRHTADLAHSHLLHLAEASGAGADTIFAIPGNFSAQQLSILLGVAQHSPWNAVGLVDSALAAAATVANDGSPGTNSYIHLDLQLHQVLATRLEWQDGRLQVARVAQIPGIGRENLIATLLQASNDAFIQQCRFNPQHSAEHEQALYNELKAWLGGRGQDAETLVLELKTSTATHTAKLPRSQLVTLLRRHYQKITDQISALDGERDTQLLLAEPLALLPELQLGLANTAELKTVTEAAALEGALRYRQFIEREAGALELVRHLKLGKVISPGAASPAPARSQSPATHVLCGHRAVAAKGLHLRCDPDADKGGSVAAGVLTLKGDGEARDLGQFSSASGELLFDSGTEPYSLNGASRTGSSRLSAGDQLAFPGTGLELVLIEVSNGG